MKVTKFFKPEEVGSKWYLVDAKGKSLGRISTKIADILRGKHKPTYTPNQPCGDFVVVINAKDVEIKANPDKRFYYSHSGYPGGLKVKTFTQLKKTFPERLIYHSVKGMLPKNKLSRRLIKHLKVYRGPEHPHAAQKPEPIDL